MKDLLILYFGIFIFYPQIRNINKLSLYYIFKINNNYCNKNTHTKDHKFNIINRKETSRQTQTFGHCDKNLSSPDSTHTAVSHRVYLTKCQNVKIILFYLQLKIMQEKAYLHNVFLLA